MSELKAVHAFDVYEAYTKTGDDDAAQVYLKSEADKVIARHKYKRCLAMALLWLERAENSTDLENELVSRRRCSKWLEIAEKFKEAK